MAAYDDWFVVAHVAEVAGVARTTVIRDIKKGKLKAEKVKVELWEGRLIQEWYVVEPAECQRWIEERKARGEARGRKRQLEP